MHALLKRCGLAALLGLSLGLSLGTAQAEPACTALAQLTIDQRRFLQTAEQYRRLHAQDAASASRLLLCLQPLHRALAETLLLFQPRLLATPSAAADVEAAFVHYVVNSQKPRLAAQEQAGLPALLARYRTGLLLSADTLRADDCGPPPWTLARLRCLGQQANGERYGRGDVVPIELLALDPGEDASYSTRRASWMAELAALAYWHPARIETQLARWGFSGLRILSDADTDTDTFGFVARRGALQVVVFRGTSSVRDFVTDASIRREPLGWGRGSVHRGFKRAADSVWPQLQQALASNEAAAGTALWITGHSLGAALAQLSAQRLQASGRPVQAVYTFGTPHIGDAAFAADYDRLLGQRTHAHVNANDLVTRVPPQALGFEPTARLGTRVFTGRDHRMSLGLAQDGEADRNWRERALDSLRSSTAFLPEALRPAALTAQPPGSAPRLNLYATGFESGALDEHGAFEYLFKLVCATLEDELWRQEQRRALAPAR